MTEKNLIIAINNLDYYLSCIDYESPHLEDLVVPLLEVRNLYLKKYCPPHSKKNWSIVNPKVKNILNKIQWIGIYEK